MLPLLVSFAFAAEPPALQKGRSIYSAKCQACHGPQGKGDGPVARALPKPPADLSAPAYWRANKEADVRAIITSGKPGSVMRGFPMKPAQMDALVLYLRSLPEASAKAP